MEEKSTSCQGMVVLEIRVAPLHGPMSDKAVGKYQS